MLVTHKDDCVRMTGRWGLDHDGVMSATAPGAYFELGFEGEMALLHFDVNQNAPPLPHLWIELDACGRVEVPLDGHLRVAARGQGPHVVRVILKSSVEQQSRWHQPLSCKLSFVGATVDRPAKLPPDERHPIEFVGDSITEGIWVDIDYWPKPMHAYDQHNRVYQDDVCAGYAWLTAERLNLRPILMGYGALGVTKAGFGGVVPAPAAYPYVFAEQMYQGPEPRIVVINHGANDALSGADDAQFIACYDQLVSAVQHRHPSAIIVILAPFLGEYRDALAQYAARKNQEVPCKLHFIDTLGWVPREPLHPLRDGHRHIADRLSPLIRELL